MLRYLQIRNLSVIESLEITFLPGLNVITGETGAGKSIVVGAVGLLLGDRASSDVVRTGEEKANIQAVFEDDGREIIVRREITSQGRSRSFVDGQLVTAARARELGVGLVDLHGQHDHQALLDPDTHLDLLDHYAGFSPDREATAAAHAEWAALRADQDAVRARERDREARTEFLKFQLGEIERVAPSEGEDEALAGERKLLANAEKVRGLCEGAYATLYENDASVIASLASVWRRVAELRDMDARFAPFLEVREGVDAQLADLAAFLREYAARVDASPERLQDIEERLAALERLKRKYGPALADVIGRRRRAAEELAALDSSAERLAELERLGAAAGERYLARARALSAARRRKAPDFSRALVAELAALAMERTRFEVRFEEAASGEDRWTARGIDAAQFFVSPNPGEELRPLARVVSGGELSRVMLALKTIATTDAPGRTLVFDEIDAGIGGRVADIVGRRLRGLGRTFQVLCITHLPQIAACGDWHFRVSKEERRGRTQAFIEVLPEDARVDELARMMAGLVVTDGTRAGAREMLRARRGESEAGTKGERRKRS